MFKKLLITGGIALLGYVINDVRKEYDKNVNDYNNLLDKYNEMSDFISKCDFYNYKDSKANDANSRYITEVQTLSDGTKCNIKRDVTSGFSVISCKDA